MYIIYGNNQAITRANLNHLNRWASSNYLLEFTLSGANIPEFKTGHVLRVKDALR